MSHLTIEKREGARGVNPRVYVGEEQVELQGIRRMQINFEPQEVPCVLLEVHFLGQQMKFDAELETIVVGDAIYDLRPREVLEDDEE
jgi:hypothetical protein